jgi:endonuclease/exonuclease/phosphatase family metal-dependent hydrolase
MMHRVKLTILQWNVWYKEDVQKITEALKKMDADIFCLQELTHGYIKEHDKSSWEYIADSLDLKFCFQEIPIIKKDSQWLQANVILSKYPIENQKKLWLHEPVDDKDPSDQYRGYLEASIAVDDTQVSVGTTHMSFGVKPEEDKELDRLLEIASSHKQKFILTGDINAVPDSRRIKELAKKLKHAGPDFNQNTWTNKPFDLPEFKADTLDWRYDYNFTSEDFKVVKSDIIKTDVSDHLPVIVRLELN